MVTPGGLVVLTSRRLAGGSLRSVVAAAVRGGAAWVILRERDLPYAARRDLFDSLRAVVPAGRLIVAGPDPLGGDAVHLAENDPMPFSPVKLVGRSRHSSFVSSADAHYLTMSPVYPTVTKPGYGPALGPDEAARRASGWQVPWLALGGVDSAARAAECASAGAAGIAVLGAVMRSHDPARTAAELSEGFAAAAAGRPSPVDNHPNLSDPAGFLDPPSSGAGEAAASRQDRCHGDDGDSGHLCAGNAAGHHGAPA